MKYTLVSFLCLILLVTCKKYPEGGFIKQGPKNIIGTWKLSLYEVNGIDSTDLINYNNDEGYKEVSFLREQTKYNPNLYAHPRWAQENIIGFSEKNKIISFGTNGSYNGAKVCGGTPIFCVKQFLNPEVGTSIDWTILKLTKKELILTSSQKNNYKIILIK